LTTINFIAASELFMVASSPTRLRVLAALSDRDMMVFELVEATGTESSSLSQHLKRLKEAGLVKSRRRGQHIRYELVPGISERLVLFMHRNFQLNP